MSILRREFIICATIGTLSYRLAEAQERAITDVTGTLKRALTDYVAKVPQAVGVSVGALAHGKILTANIGTTRLGLKSEPAADTLYGIASITKTFTAALLAQQVLRGRLSLNDDVRQYIDGSYANLQFNGSPITIAHLLNHNSGLPFNLPIIPENRPPFPPASPDVVRRLASYSREEFFRDLHSVKLERVPGIGYSYSNAGAILLSYILEKVTGKTFSQLLRENITAPLEMNDTAIELTPEQSIRMAVGYDENHSVAPPIYNNTLGAAAIKSTVTDLLKYARWQMDESDPAVKLSHAPQMITADRTIGLNWQITAFQGRRRIWQNGTTPGYSSMCILLPEPKIALVALSNELDLESLQKFKDMTRDMIIAIEPAASRLFPNEP